MSNKNLKLLRQLAIKLIVVGAIITILLIFVFGLFPLHGNYMFPALRDGDLCITYKLDKIRVNDVVAYKQDGIVKFGRIVGMPGDQIQIDKNTFKVNGILPSESIFYETTNDNPIDVTVQEDEYYILNDMRTDINDSRSFGNVKKSQLKGKLFYLLRRRGF